MTSRQELFSAAKITAHAAAKIPDHPLAAALHGIAAALEKEAKISSDKSDRSDKSDPSAATPPKVAVGTESSASPASRASGTFGGTPGTVPAPPEPDLKAILSEEGSDKTTRHRYGDVYIEELSRFQGIPAKILEVGVRGGASLRAYARLLPQAELWGIDVRPPAINTPGKLLRGDGYAADTWRDLPQFDVIIDDGSHRPADMLRGLPVFLDHLAPGGTLMIEDIPTEEAAQALLDACPGAELIRTEPTSKHRDDRIVRYHKPGPPVDLIVPLGTGSQSDNDELRILLRSAEKNCLDLGKIYICATSAPAWLTGAEVLPVPDSHKHNKDANLIQKFLAACKASSAAKVVRCSDDQVFLRPVRLNSLPLFRRGKAPTSYGDGKWSRRMVHTGEWLAEHGHPLAVCFDTHCPQVFDRAQVPELLRGVDWYNEQLCINTLLMGLRGATWGAPQTRYKSTFEGEAKLYPIDPRHLFAGYNDGAFLHGLRAQLFELFPEPSRFERC